VAYECLNPRCPHYAGNGVRLTNEYVYVDANRRLHCRVCRSFVRLAPARTDGNEKRVLGATGGALVGFAVGGPAGALIGGVLGLLIGDNAGSGSK